jgi:DNA-binding PadR family transcriptional regulator
MERDWNIIETILTDLEKGNHYRHESMDAEELAEMITEKNEVEDQQDVADSVIYNIDLLMREDYIAEVEVGDEKEYTLTWKGHDLLDNLRGEDLPDAPRSRQF